VGFKIDEKSLPIQQEIVDFVSSERSVLADFALYTGGDFELLCTVSPDMLEAAQSACYLNVIGEVVDREVGTTLRCRNGENLTINRKGYLQLGN
jgi:thiamine-monophosphate kinase